jgi:hypothetical protein
VVTDEFVLDTASAAACARSVPWGSPSPPLGTSSSTCDRYGLSGANALGHGPMTSPCSSGAPTWRGRHVGHEVRGGTGSSAITTGQSYRTAIREDPSARPRVPSARTQDPQRPDRSFSGEHNARRPSRERTRNRRSWRGSATYLPNRASPAIVGERCVVMKRCLSCSQWTRDVAQPEGAWRLAGAKAGAIHQQNRWTQWHTVDDLADSNQLSGLQWTPWTCGHGLLSGRPQVRVLPGALRPGVSCPSPRSAQRAGVPGGVPRPGRDDGGGPLQHCQSEPNALNRG